MHEHNHNGQKHSSMLWMMLLCALPLVILFFVGGSQFSTGYLWPILVGAMIVAHIGMMLKGHGGHNNADENPNTDSSNEHPEKNKKQHGGCCH